MIACTPPKFDPSDQRDFGVGWSLSIRQGSVEQNRPVGEDFVLAKAEGIFSLPCQKIVEQKYHEVEVRLSEREHYRFRPILTNPQALSGGGMANVFYEYVDGTTRGDQFMIEGNTGVRAPMFKASYPGEQPRRAASSSTCSPTSPSTPRISSSTPPMAACSS